jgi:hypothetical protein
LQWREGSGYDAEEKAAILRAFEPAAGEPEGSNEIDIAGQTYKYGEPSPCILDIPARDAIKTLGEALNAAPAPPAGDLLKAVRETVNAAEGEELQRALTNARHWRAAAGKLEARKRIHVSAIKDALLAMQAQDYTAAFKALVLTGVSPEEWEKGQPIVFTEEISEQPKEEPYPGLFTGLKSSVTIEPPEPESPEPLSAVDQLLAMHAAIGSLPGHPMESLEDADDSMKTDASHMQQYIARPDAPGLAPALTADGHWNPQCPCHKGAPADKCECPF